MTTERTGNPRTLVPPPLAEALSARYRLQRELGQGGMATVYLAHDVRHERPVAIKVLRPDLAAVIGAERFLREIKVLATLQHPHIVGLIDSGEVQGTAYYVMPFVEGESLRDRLRRERQLPVADAIQIASEVAGALDYAHRRGVIHRDIKPENILLHEGEAMLADFGIALAVKEAGGSRLTETGLSLGTPQYMSPEQAAGDNALDARTDVYSLGAVLYEMLAGEPPFGGPTAQAVIAKLMTERPIRLRVARETVPHAVDAAVARALAKVPADRYPSAGAFAAALSLEPTTARLPKVGLRRRSAALVAGVVLLLATGGTALVRSVRRPSAPSPATRLQITFSGRADLPVLSPDAAHVAYVERRDCAEGADCPSDIVVQEASANGSRRTVGSVHDGNVWEWSPDGRRLLVSDVEDNAVVNTVLTVLSGELKELGARQAIWTSSPDTMLTWLIGARDDKVWITTVRASDFAPVDSFAFGPTWLVNGIRVSPDGRWLAVQHTRRNSVLSRLAIVDRRGVIRDSVDNVDGLVGWGRASDRFYYKVWDQGVRTESEVFRQRIDPEAGRRVGVPAALGRFRASSLHLAGNVLVLDETGPAESTVWALERSGVRGPWQGRELQRSTARGSAVISRDGSRVIHYVLQESEDTVLIRIGTRPFVGADAGPTPVSLTGVRWFQASSDGKQAVVVFRAAGAPVRLVDLDTGANRELGPPPTPAGIVYWTADGRFVWLPDDPGEIIVLDSRWRVERRIPWSDSSGVPLLAAPAPGTPEVAVITLRPAGDSMGFALHRVPLDGGPVRLISRSAPVRGWELAELPRWIRDGWIYLPFRDPGRGGRLFRVRVTDGRVEDQGTPPMKGRVLEGFTISDDGRRAVEWIADRSRDIVLIRNFDPEADK